MSVLLLRLAGPMQSWGTQSRFLNRDTGLEPSKSGVVGLLCAALGFARDAKSITRGGVNITVSALAGLKMGVRVDREGLLSRDYHTAGGEHRKGATLGLDAKGNPRRYGVLKADAKSLGTVVSERYYLADAEFLVGLIGDPALLDQLKAALARPIWPLYLGRKAYVPSCPFYACIVEQPDLLAAFSLHPWWRRRQGDVVPPRLRLVLETDYGIGSEVRQDVPIGFGTSARLYGHCTSRHVETRYIPDSQSKFGLPPVEDAPWLT